MSKFRTSVRIVNRLLISIFLVLTPLFGIVAPVGATTPADLNMRLPWAGGTHAVSQGYSCGTHDGSGYSDWDHDRYALDFPMATGTPVTAAFDGVLHTHDSEVSGYGKYVWVQKDNIRSIYAHLSSVKSNLNGQQVTRGQVIAYSGNTDGSSSISTGPHLHFSLRDMTGNLNSDSPFTGAPVEPKPLSGYSDFANISCDGNEHGSYNPNNGAPGGWWVTPTSSVIAPGQQVNVKVRAEDNNHGGLAEVNITIEDYSDHNGWSRIWSESFATNYLSKDVTHSFEMPNTEYIRISFDVYSKDGWYQLAPSGIKTICSSSNCNPPTAYNPSDPYGTIGGGGSSGGGSGGSQTNCVPGQYQAAVFTDPNFGGSCVIKGIGEYPNPESIGLPNDSISSIKVGSGANVRLCDNAGLNSPCEYFSQDDNQLSYFDSMPDNATSSMKVEGGGPTTNCQPGPSEVAFFMNENYQETCTIRGVGRYNDASALGLPNDTISSVKVGARVWVRICDNVNNDSPCDQFEYDRPDLTPTTVQNNRASSAEVFLKGGIALCDNDLSDNNGGECKYFGAGDVGENLQNMSSHGFDNRVQSVRYDPDWEGRYHIVLYVDQNQTGALAHYDGTVNALQDPYRNNISSIKIYKNHPPNARALAPANGAVFPATTSSVTLNYTEGQERRIHVWSNNGYDFTSDWAPTETYTLNGLAPGTYSWQAQSRSPIIGEGAWSAVQTFSINTPPTVSGGNLTLDAGTTQSIQVQAFDAEGGTLTLTASGLPAFATFTDNGGGIGTLQLNPTTSQSGQYNITVTANDGTVSGTGTIAVTVNAVTPPPPPAGYQANYFNNLTLSGTPVLTRDEATINNDWGGGGPGNGVNSDNFSARWTRTTDFAAGDYTFSVTADDGVRLYIDGVLAIDKWVDQGPTTYTTTKTLAAGNHTLKVDYYEYGGGAVAKFSYQAVVAPAPDPGPGTDYSFLKGVNFNGNAVTIGGNAWQSMSTALGDGLSFPSGYQTASTSLAPNPGVDSDTNAMLNTVVWKSNAPLPINQTVANGDHKVYLWIMENYQTNNRKINVKLEGTQVATDIGYLTKNDWVKYGPYNATVGDGTLNLELVNAVDSPHVMGMAIYKKNGTSTPPPAPTPTPTTGITSGNTYKLVNPNSTKALDVNGATAADGTNVHIWTDTGVAAQKWQITQNSDGTYKLLNPITNRVLDVNGGGTNDGTNVHIWTANNSAAQKWSITQNADGTYKLVNPNSNKALDINGGGTANGTNVHIWTDNGSAAQKWQIVDVTTAPPPTVLTFTGNGTASPTGRVAGEVVTLNASFTSTTATNATTKIHLEIRNPSDQIVFTKDFDNEAFTPGQTKNYTATWTVPQGAATGNYKVKGGAVSADWGTWHLWSDNLGQFTVNAPPATPAGTELLSSAWNLVGNNGASEKYQSIAPNALAGKTTLRVTYNLHGISALGGDASAIIFDQNGWKFVSLSNYGQNGLNGSQTVDIPLSAFGLDLSQPVGTLHTRFWYGSAFTVDITSIQVL